MRRYFFDLENHSRDEDDEGQMLDSAEKARTEAVIFAGAYLRDNPGLLTDGNLFVVRVRDDQGATLVRVIVQAEPPL